MKITTLSENLTYKRSLFAEHGLSLHIESDDHCRILFDTGASNQFLKNAKTLNIDISKVDYLILSHGHDDHTGGIKHFLEINKKAKVVLKEEVFFNKFKMAQYIGFPKKIHIPKKRIIYADKITNICSGVDVCSLIEIKNKRDTHFNHFFIKKDNHPVEKDSFEDELFVSLTKNNYVSILTGCSHRGITNIIETCVASYGNKIDKIIGGFHFDIQNKKQCDFILEYFKRCKYREVHVSHCTRVDGYLLLKKLDQRKVFYNSCGSTINIS